MSVQEDTRRKTTYTPEFRLQAVRMVTAGQSVAVTARVLGIPPGTLAYWVWLHGKGRLRSPEVRAAGAGLMGADPGWFRRELAQAKVERFLAERRVGRQLR